MGDHVGIPGSALFSFCHFCHFFCPPCPSLHFDSILVPASPHDTKILARGLTLPRLEMRVRQLGRLAPVDERRWPAVLGCDQRVVAPEARPPSRSPRGVVSRRWRGGDGSAPRSPSPPSVMPALGLVLTSPRRRSHSCRSGGERSQQPFCCSNTASSAERAASALKKRGATCGPLVKALIRENRRDIDRKKLTATLQSVVDRKNHDGNGTIAYQLHTRRGRREHGAGICRRLLSELSRPVWKSTSASVNLHRAEAAIEQTQITGTASRGLPEI